jgi:hypothetical protein
MATCLATVSHHISAPNIPISSMKNNVLCGSSTAASPAVQADLADRLVPTYLPTQPALRLAGDRFRKGSQQVRMRLSVTVP